MIFNGESKSKEKVKLLSIINFLILHAKEYECKVMLIKVGVVIKKFFTYRVYSIPLLQILDMPLKVSEITLLPFS